MLIGVISDTHGLLRPQALAALAGVNHIFHAGDLGDDAILDLLAQIAPVTAIRGNIDQDGRAAHLPLTEAIVLGGKLFYLVHSIHDLDLNPEAAQIDMVISGHSHKPGVETRSGVIYLNPGSAGPLRFRLPITLALVEISGEILDARILNLLNTDSTT